MHRRFLRRNLAAWRHFPVEVKEVVDLVLLGHRDALDELAANPTRSASVVPAVYGKKLPPADLARQVCSAPLRPEEFALVVPREKRVTVLTEFFRRNPVDVATLAAVAEKASPAVARELLDMYEELPMEMRVRLAQRAGGLSLLQEVCFGSEDAFPDAFAVELLASSGVLNDSSFRDHARWQCLTTLFSRRPGLLLPLLGRLHAQSSGDTSWQRTFSTVTYAAAHASNLDPAAVSFILDLQESFHVWEYRQTLEGLVKNPFVSLESLDRIRSGPHADEFSVRNALKSPRQRVSGHFGSLTDQSEVATASNFVRSNYWTSSLWAAVELLGNPLLDQQAVEELRSLVAMRSRGQLQRLLRKELVAAGIEVHPPRTPREAPAQSAPSDEVVSDLEKVTELLGADRGAWEAFAGLLNEFEGSLLELAEIAAAV